MEAAALALLKRDASVRKAVTKAKIARADTRRAPSKGSALLIVAETSTGCLLAGDALSGKGGFHFYPSSFPIPSISSLLSFPSPSTSYQASYAV
mmetsp:Transcript_48398/g.125545  ORF Transcript_48398/g.125545 Transcript_48398/m.125545 type:complete len:94 (-) Transcript_48398:227-508(-)